MILVDIASKNEGGIFHVNSLVEDDAWYSLINDHNVKIFYVKRDYLKGADSLANQEKDTREVITLWC